MTKPETALRELNEKLTAIVEKHNGMTFLDVTGCVSDLTALISEHYVAKEEVDKMVDAKTSRNGC